MVGNISGNMTMNSKVLVKPWKNSMKTQRSVVSEETESKLQEYMKDNQDLMEIIKTHEMMEEFYLKELQLQKNEKKDLEWRLSILSDELNLNIRPKTIQKQRSKARILALTSNETLLTPLPSLTPLLPISPVSPLGQE